MTATTVAVIGAGLSGLAAARQLVAAGYSVQVIDKGRGPGGRLATRRIGEARLDHGAQFFTVRGDDFAGIIDEAIAAGVVDVWCHGFDDQDGYPRHYCPDGMTALAKWLTEQVRVAGATVSLGERVSTISAGNDGWHLHLGSEGSVSGGTVSGGAVSGETVDADHVIVTSPVPQTLELLDGGGVEIDTDVRATLDAINYKPTLALLATLDSPSAIPAPGGVQLTEDDVFTFIADNQQKGISPVPAVTFHANGQLSADRWDDDPELVLSDLLAEAQPWLGTATVIEAQLKKWKYAGPRNPYAERYLVAATTPGQLVLAGDAFGGPKVEGAFNSGQASARAVIGE